MATINIYTDGACRGNPGPGAWAFAVYAGKEYKGSKYKFLGHTTNNKAEMHAVIQALTWLQKLKPSNKVVIHIDSSYVKDGYEKWLGNWKRRGWRTAAGTQVKNETEWRAIDALKTKCMTFDISFHKVKGHAGIEGNEKADELCNLALDEQET